MILFVDLRINYEIILSTKEKTANSPYKSMSDDYMRRENVTGKQKQQQQQSDNNNCCLSLIIIIIINNIFEKRENEKKFRKKNKTSCNVFYNVKIFF